MILFFLSLVHASCFYSVTIDPKNVYDGDTIKNVSFQLDFDLTTVKTIRLLGVDTPELNKKAERAAGLKARDRLRELIKGCEKLRVSTYGVGSFGRTLAKLYCGNESLNDKLISEGLAVVWKK